MMKLALSPEASTYSAKPGAETISVALEGGSSRFRRDILGAAAEINCEWRLNEIEHQYFMAFYRSATRHGSLPFAIDLMLDSPWLQEYIAHFVPGSLELAGVAGEARIMRAVLEVLPLAEDEALDGAIVAIYGIYGDQMNDFFADLAELVNVTMPGALG